MKKILKEIILGLFGSLAYIFFSILLKTKKQTIFVINYHATYPEYNQNFIKQIKFYKKNFDLIGENYFFKEKKKINKKPKLLITFDDGHISNYHIMKILDKYKIPAIFFIPYQFINRKREKNILLENKVTNKKYNIISSLKKDIDNQYKTLSMSFKELRRLSKNNYSIGAHGYSHIRLSQSLKKKKLEREIIDSKKFLEKKLQIKINSFCWTFGDLKSYSANASKIIKKNYKLSFMTCAKPFEFDQSLFQIHRFNIENFFSLFHVAFVLSGIYELIYFKKRKYVNKLTK